MFNSNVFVITDEEILCLVPLSFLLLMLKYFLIQS